MHPDLNERLDTIIARLEDLGRAGSALGAHDTATLELLRAEVERLRSQFNRARWERPPDVPPVTKDAA